MKELQEPVIVEFYLGVTRCPPGAAANAIYLRQRGHMDWPEITVWPKHEHYRLTTGRESLGLGLPDPVKLNQAERDMCAILGLNELELGIFLRQWTPLVAYHEKAKSGERPSVENCSRHGLEQAFRQAVETGEFKWQAKR